MKTINLVLGFVMIVGTHAASAKADPACANCGEFEQLALKIKNNPDANDDAKQKLGPFATGRVKVLAADEARAMINLLLEMLRADDREHDGDAAGAFANIYKRFPKQIGAAIKERSTDEQIYLKNQRRLGEQSLREGNG